MKKLLFCLLAISVTLQVSAQSINYTLSNPSGTFTSGVWPVFKTAKLDTVTAGATTTDTQYVHVTKGYYTSFSTNNLNSITFQYNVVKIAGRIDSLTIKTWGSIDGVNYVSLNSQTSANASGTLQALINSGAGNPYTDYMVTSNISNVASSSSASIREYVLVR